MKQSPQGMDHDQNGSAPSLAERMRAIAEDVRALRRGVEELLGSDRRQVPFRVNTDDGEAA
jgi:hypothetical protein